VLQQSYFLIAAQAYFRLALCPDITEEFQFFLVIAVDGVETKIILVFYRHGINCSSRVTGAARPITFSIRYLPVYVCYFGPIHCSCAPKSCQITLMSFDRRERSHFVADGAMLIYEGDGRHRSRLIAARRTAVFARSRADISSFKATISSTTA
jgi:hypothetical protein